MGVIACCAFTQMAGLNARIGRVEESVAAVAGVLVNGLGESESPSSRCCGWLR